MWIGPQFVARPRNLDTIIVNGELEFRPSSIYWERMALIEALEKFLETPPEAWQCGEQNTTSV